MYECLEQHQHLCAWMCGSLGHHRQPRPLVVLEPWALSTPWCLRCAGASSSIGTLVLGCAGALDTIGNLGRWICGCLEQHRHLGAWMCGSLGHHWQPRPSVMQEP
ncbi:hypothetical protein GOBAR_AA13378 [Gossypium barbadense]|uniref:Uncharacterized protein n=1 Tax=Gossypium barbadense TaxID=3634 RepID=A0A2P5XV93_GOSBA|nr:hypothetical protein GOBAR_AA13378 [Gossypium barbadense]